MIPASSHPVRERFVSEARGTAVVFGNVAADSFL